MITSKQIRETECFKTMDDVQKSLIVKKSQLDKINLGVNMSKLQSFDFWVEKTSPRHHVKTVVQELVVERDKIQHA